jgi:hypothetical protein
VSLEPAEIVAELVGPVGVLGEVEGGEDGVVDLLGGPAAELSAAMQETSSRRMMRGSWILMPG